MFVCVCGRGAWRPWTVSRFKGGLGKKEGGSVFEREGGGGVFEGAVDTPMHNMFIKLLRNLRY